MRKWIVVALVALFSTGPHAQTVERLIRDWQAANTTCRGSSDPSVSDPACDRRERLTLELEKLGWCYGNQGDYGYQKKWGKCTQRSIREGQ